MKYYINNSFYSKKINKYMYQKHKNNSNDIFLYDYNIDKFNDKNRLKSRFLHINLLFYEINSRVKDKIKFFILYFKTYKRKYMFEFFYVLRYLKQINFKKIMSEVTL